VGCIFNSVEHIIRYLYLIFVDIFESTLNAKVLDFLVLQFLTYTNVIISELSYLFLFLPTRVIRAINITVGTL
jgi:hypothetical protein